MIARRLTFLLLCAVVLSEISPAKAFAAKPFAIPRAYVEIAAENRVPPEILFVVSLGESGTKLTSGRVLPWPWTLNIAGKSRYFRTRVETYTALLAAIRESKLVDISLGQVNWQSHAEAFHDDPWRALEPFENLRVAARLLRTLYDASGGMDWWAAVGNYHSPGKKSEQRARAQSYSANARARYYRLFGTQAPIVLAENSNE